MERVKKTQVKTKSNLVNVRSTLHDAQRRNAIHKGASPWGEDTDIMNRLSKEAKGDWENVHRHFNRFKAMVRARYMNSDYGADPLLVLEVKPLKQRGIQFPTTQPPNSETPWHITVDFSDSRNSAKMRRMRRLIETYSTYKEYTLVGHIQGSSFELDRLRCEVGRDPLLQQLHDAGYYGDRPLHISL